MKEEIKIDWDLKAKYLADNLNVEESEALKHWEQEQATNAREIDSLSDSWNLSAAGKNTFRINEDTAWLKVKSRINEATKPVETKHPVILITSRFAKLAAGILILAAIATTLYMLTGKLHSPTGMLTATNDSNLPLSVKLSDGSIVTLNKGARLDYPEKFNAITRELTVSGEAFFEVNHDPAKPFIVHTFNSTIKVLGTSFDILASRETGELKVIVESGLVELRPEKQEIQKILLEKGMVGAFNSNESSPTKKLNSDENYMSWKTKILRFNRTSMLEVVKVLNRTYHSEIYITESKLQDCLLTANFSDLSIDTVLKTLQQSFNLQIINRDKKIYLTGKACNGQNTVIN